MNESQPIVQNNHNQDEINSTMDPDKQVEENHSSYGSTQYEIMTTKNKSVDDSIVRPPLHVYIVAACAALNSCNLGFDVGVNSPAGILVQEYLQLSDEKLEVFMGSINFFALGGALLSSKLIHYFGMLKSFVLSSLIFLSGICVICFSNTFQVIMIGRMLVGFGVGFGFAITPMYLAEISPKSHRGAFVSWSEIGCNIGILLGFLTGFWFYTLPVNLSWRYMFGVGGILPLVVAILAGVSSTNYTYAPNEDSSANYSIRMPMVESPRWLVTHGKYSQALIVLTQIHPVGYDVQRVLKEIQADIENETHNNHDESSSVGWSYLLLHPSPTVKRMLLVGLGIALIHQATGIDAIQYYLVFIMEASGITERTMQAQYLVSLGLLKVLCLFLSSNLVDKLGRRPLMFASLSGMSIAVFLMAFDFFFLAHDDDATTSSSSSTTGVSLANQLVLFGLAFYLISFSLGLGPLGWVLPPELFSTTIRSKAVSCTTFANRVTATIVTSSMLSIANTITWGGYFCLLGILCLFSLFFCYHYLPETKGRPLEEMTHYFATVTNDYQTLASLPIIK